MQALEDQQDIRTIMEGSEDHLSAIPFLKTMFVLVSLNNFAKFERLVIMFIRIKDYHLCKLICWRVNKQKWYLEKGCTNNGMYFPNLFFDIYDKWS
jgi:hypothetical protein